MGYSFTKDIGRGGMVIFIGGASEYGSHSKLFIEHCGTLHSTPLSISLALQAPLLSAKDTFDEQPNTLVHKQGIKPTDKETCKESKTQHLLTNYIYPLYCAAHQFRQQVRHDICQKIYTARFSGQEFYTGKMRNLQPFHSRFMSEN